MYVEQNQMTVLIRRTIIQAPSFAQQKAKHTTPQRQPTSQKRSSCQHLSRSHNHTARVLLLRLRIKHLALRAQPVALGHQAVNLLPALQHALNRLVQHNLRLVQLLLDLHDAVRLLRVLVLGDVLLQLREGQLGRGGKGGPRILGQELVDDLREQLVRDEGGVFVV
jgi:hypothetical protein